MTNTLSDNWNASRSGARASRGFRYQDAVTALLITKAWSGAIKGYVIIPEGHDDITLEDGHTAHLIQIKSKSASANPFQASDIKRFENEIEARSERLRQSGLTIASKSVVLERAPSHLLPANIDQFVGHDNEGVKLYEALSPETAANAVLLNKLNIPGAAAPLIFQVLYYAVGQAVDANASCKFEDRTKFTITDIDRLITTTIEKIDIGALEAAIQQRLCMPVDFTTVLNDPNFYFGVDTQPGHLAAGLLTDRSEKCDAIEASLIKTRCTLISGPSGSGKSALQWMVADRTSHAIRWYRVAAFAQFQDTASFLQLIDRLQASEQSPIGFIVDDVGRKQSDLWNTLARESLQKPGVFLLGSIRTEDTALIANTALSIISVSLDEPLAEDVWKKLRERNATNLSYWREAFEQSNGLLLEYIHILTQGERLSTLVSNQVQRRYDEKRTTELSILRICSFAAQYGSHIDVKALVPILAADSDAVAIANQRLINEHLVRQPEPGILGGLHEIRSQAILKASHDNLSLIIDDSADLACRCVTPDSLPLFLFLALKEKPERLAYLIEALSARLQASPSIEVLRAAFTGLGLVTLHEFSDQWVAILKTEELEPGNWAIATMMGAARRTTPLDSKNDIPALEKINNAVKRLSEIGVSDKRILLLDAINKIDLSFSIDDINAFESLLSSMGPMVGFPALPLERLNPGINLGTGFKRWVSTLQTVNYFDRNLSNRIISEIGGQSHLLNMAYREIPWITRPEIRTDGEFANAVCADVYAITEEYSSNSHEKVIDLCEILLAISPEADGVIVRAITASGAELRLGDAPPVASKRIPRQNLPPKSLQRWNQIFISIVIARGSASSETVYAESMADLVARTQAVFDMAVKAFCRDKRKPFLYKHYAEAEDVARQSNQYTAGHAATPNTSLIPQKQVFEISDKISSLVSGICGNLIPRLLKYDPQNPDKGIASFAMGLLDNIDIIRRAPLWRLVENPPMEGIDAIEKTIKEFRPILGELTTDPVSYASILFKMKKELPDKAIRIGSRLCKQSALGKIQWIQKALENKLKYEGFSCEVHAVLPEKDDGFFWPVSNYAILVRVNTLLDFLSSLDRIVAVVSGLLPQIHVGYILPVISGKIFGQSAIQSRGERSLPCPDIGSLLGGRLPIPFMEGSTANVFDTASAALIECACIAAVRDLSALHPDEANALDSAQNRFQYAFTKISELSAADADENLALARDVLALMEDALHGGEIGLQCFPNLASIPGLALSQQMDEQLGLLIKAKNHLAQYDAAKLSA